MHTREPTLRVGAAINDVAAGGFSNGGKKGGDSRSKSLRIIKGGGDMSQDNVWVLEIVGLDDQTFESEEIHHPLGFCYRLLGGLDPISVHSNISSKNRHGWGASRWLGGRILLQGHPARQRGRSKSRTQPEGTSPTKCFQGHPRKSIP